MIRELDTVVLETDRPEAGLKRGAIGTVVSVHGEGEAYEVEFDTLDGHRMVILTVDAANISQNQIQQAELEAQFQQLAERWKTETLIHSSPAIIVRNDAYQAIVAMGQPVVQLILESLREEPAYWFQALREITGENPIPMDHRGNMKAMTADWLDWGRARGLID